MPTSNRLIALRLHRAANGLCRDCGRDVADHSRTRCASCLEVARLAARRRQGSRPWQAGKPGRPPAG